MCECLQSSPWVHGTQLESLLELYDRYLRGTFNKADTKEREYLTNYY